MPAKKKPDRRHAVVQIVSAHPWISWGTLASIVAVLGALCLGVLWVVEHLETRGEALSHSSHDDQVAAWNRYAISDVKTLILRNRLNECNTSTAKRTVLEERVCKQYQDEYDAAAQLSKKLYDAAMATTKETP